MIYTYRKTTFTKTETYVLEHDVIKMYYENNMLIDSVSLSDIKSISLVHTPTKVARNMHQCTITTFSKKKIVLRNYSYLGLANFKNQNEEYLKFIYELHDKIKNKNIQFKKGINKLGFLVMLTFLILMIGLMGIIAVVLFNKEKYAEMGISGFAAILFLFLTITSVARFKPENYEPNNIPKNALPQ